MTSYGCRYCKSTEVLLCETIEQPYYVMKSKMAAPGNLKAKIGDNQILFSRLYFRQFNVNLFQEWRFPLNWTNFLGSNLHYNLCNISLNFDSVRSKIEVQKTNRKNKTRFSVRQQWL